VEDRGFESLWVIEHTHIPTSRATPWPRAPDLPEQHKSTLYPFVALAGAAAVTTRLGLATGICLVTVITVSVSCSRSRAMRSALTVGVGGRDAEVVGCDRDRHHGLLACGEVNALTVK
jgi:hypothetical protein